MVSLHIVQWKLLPNDEVSVQQKCVLFIAVWVRFQFDFYPFSEPPIPNTPLGFSFTSSCPRHILLQMSTG